MLGYLWFLLFSIISAGRNNTLGVADLACGISISEAGLGGVRCHHDLQTANADQYDYFNGGA